MAYLQKNMMFEYLLIFNKFEYLFLRKCAIAFLPVLAYTYSCHIFDKILTGTFLFYQYINRRTS